MQSSGQPQPLARADWAQLFAFAWLHSGSVLQELRKDPKKAIIELANGTIPSDPDTQGAAKIIQNLADNTPMETYSGYLPIPRCPLEDRSKLSEKDLQDLLQVGLDGVLKFNVKGDLWAKVLLAAWNDDNTLKAIRQDPLEGLKRVLTEAEVKELQDSTYGILPLPDRANGLGNLKMEELVDFLGDEQNAEHLGGIFLVAT